MHQGRTEQIRLANEYPNLNKIPKSTIVNIASLIASWDIFKSFECNKRERNTNQITSLKIQFSCVTATIAGYDSNTLLCMRCMHVGVRICVRVHVRFVDFRLNICAKQQQQQHHLFNRVSIYKNGAKCINQFSGESNKSSVRLHFDSISIDVMRHRHTNPQINPFN